MTKDRYQVPGQIFVKEQTAVSRNVYNFGRSLVINFDNDPWFIYGSNGGIYVQGSGTCDGEAGEFNLDYLAPAKFSKSENDVITFFVEDGISNFYCAYDVDRCPAECTKTVLQGEFVYRDGGSTELLDLLYTQKGCEEEESEGSQDKVHISLSNVQGKVVLEDAVAFPCNEEDRYFLDVILFVPENLVPESAKLEYETKLNAVRESSEEIEAYLYELYQEETGHAYAEI